MLNACVMLSYGYHASGILDETTMFRCRLKSKHYLLLSSEAVRNIQSGISYLLNLPRAGLKDMGSVSLK